MARAKVTCDVSMPQAIQRFSVDERRALMQWLTQQGPFWDDARSHGPDDYLDCNDEVVTDTAVGEAGFCCLHGIDHRLVSLTPSSWVFSPVPVTWHLDGGGERSVAVVNYWDRCALETALQSAPVPVACWEDLETCCVARCPHLTFSFDAFGPLRGHPFVDGAANRLLSRLETLNRFTACFDEHGRRTPEGQRLYDDHFTGEKAWFSDSSETEKREFQRELTFRHPIQEGATLFCPWHGKVKTPQFRVHFSWPVRADERVYVVYVGPKITRR